MNKILDSSYCHCNCSNTFPQDTLRITAGNDFALILQLTYKDGDDWLHYDLREATDIELSAVSPNGNHVDFPCVVDDSTGNISSVIDSQSLRTEMLYGIEVVWHTTTDDLDKRAFAPNVFVFVNDSRDATESGYEYTSENPYEYNLKFNGDLAVVSIGRIPDVDMSDYYTKEQVDDTLSSYYTKEQIDTTLSSYVTTSHLSDELSNYVSDDELAQCGYLDETSMFELLASSDYIREDDIDTALQSYVTHSQLNDCGYITSSALNDYTTFNDINNMSYATTNYVNDAVQHAHVDLSDYYTKEQVDDTLSSYSTFQDIDSMGYITSSDLSDYTTFSDIDSMGYITSSDLSDYTTFSDIDSMGYITSSDLSDYTTFNDINNMSYVTYAYLDDVIQNIPAGVGEVTYDYLSAQSYVQCYDATYIYMLTQQDYDILEQNQQLDSNTFYYITDASPVYVSYAALNDMSYITMSDLNSMSYIATGDNISSLTNDSGFIASGDNISSMTNDSGFIASGDTVSSLRNDVYYVTSSDASIVDIISISQNDYDTLVNNSQTDANTLYIII